ncbi:MAG TPA: FecR domain-containing protein [Polyangiaceae bacterium]
MTTPRHAQAAAALLRRGQTDAAAPSEAERERAIAFIARGLVRKARRRVWKRSLAVGVLALSSAAALWALYRVERPAAVAGGVSALGYPRAAGAELVSGQQARPLNRGDSLVAGSELVTSANGGAALALSSGTTLDIEHDARLGVISTGASQRFSLARGALSAKVAKLGVGERFVIGTPDGEVEVRGTAFQVVVADRADDCNPRVRTRVLVSEGVVEVRALGASWRVGPGESWPSGCASPTASPALVPASPMPNASARAAASSSARERSPLVEQNDLFGKGVSAMHRGDSKAAIAAFETLLNRYPTSPLSENASAERMQLLAAADPDAAARAASEYLARFPHGFARADAERILAR